MPAQRTRRARRSPRPPEQHPGPDLQLALPAEMASPSIARLRLGRWLDALRWPAGQRDDVVLAASEAVSNSVEHGYLVDHTTVAHPGLVDVRGAVRVEADGRRHVVIMVQDRGAWLPPSSVRGHRCHGIPLMEACAETLTVEGTGAGTTVVLRSRSVPAPHDPA